jgi:Protein of unknown function (DUF1161)
MWDKASQGDTVMRSLLVIAVLVFLSMFAYAAKPCEELKAEIDKKLEAKNVKSYSLEIVDKDKATEGKVVGTCDGGTKKIVYSRTSTPAEPPAKQESKP